MSWTEERLGEPSQLQRKGDPQPWPEHLQRPDFFHRPTEHRPSAINHPLLAMEQRPTEIFGQQRPSPISGKLPLIEHRPYNDHRPITIGHRPAEHLSSIINHRPLEARQMPDLIYRNEGETSFQIRAVILFAKCFETLFPAGLVQRPSVIRRSSTGAGKQVVCSHFSLEICTTIVILHNFQS